MKEEFNPQKEYDEICDKIRLKKKQLKEVESSLAGLIDRISCAKDEENRKGLIAQRRAEKDEQEVLIAEIGYLETKKKIAYLLIYENNLAKAEAEKNQLLAENAQLRSNTFQSEVAKRKALREELSGLSYKERDKRIVEVEEELAHVRAVAFVNEQNLQRARNTIRRCEMELKQAQDEVASW